MTSRRAFLAGASALGAVAFRADALDRAAGAAEDLGDARPCDLAADEDYWGEIQRCFDADRTVVNLNNGGVSPTPTHVLEAMIRDLRFTNESPVQHMWRVLEPRVESVRRDLAREFGCDPEEIAVTRNASEAMETLIFGIDLKPGDEAIITDQNYPRMQTSWAQRARRDGIVVKKLAFPVPLTSPDDFLGRIEAAITPRTRVIEIPQVTNLTGQVLPVREVVALGKSRGIEVFVDGAHAFAQLPFRRDDLDCDYFGTSLHKWLLAPIGTGFLYIRKAKQKSIWPLMGADPELDEDVRKYEQIGTHPAANHNAVSAAIAFHRAIGVERKSARLRHLRDRWARALLDASPKFKLWTPLDPDWSCGIALVQIEGIDCGKLFGHLWDKHRIVTSPTKHAQFEGVRISANVYTTPQELDLFVDAMKNAAANGV
ncbi:aminotransferase class V-fold PLP-dependent enzyme [Paludisphaera soli]|uniref:aminotransferase class V-fold PLP-dependent enzyme n=1 Tax=Paludisphaera soli TaxID=2712865 RepID=UPI0013EACE99|nr:aminotransferase class V-fold PLP-dependent enzyme [Paludisphaera soli]